MLGLMTKYWVPGRVKTRLGQTIGMESAAALHQLFVSCLCQELAETGLRREVCAAPQESLAAIQRQIDDWGLAGRWTVTDQGDGDLGDRMQRWFRRTLGTASESRSLLIGSDCPTLSAVDIGTAMEELETHDVVLGPAVDGGYYLIGIRGAWQPEFALLFQAIPWSTDRVFAVTKERMMQLGLSSTDLPMKEDVDTIEELTNLRHSLASGSGFSALKSNLDEILKAIPNMPELSE